MCIYIYIYTRICMYVYIYLYICVIIIISNCIIISIRIMMVIRISRIIIVSIHIITILIALILTTVSVMILVMMIFEISNDRVAIRSVKLTTIISPPTPTITARYDILSGAVHTKLPYETLNIYHTGGSVVGVGGWKFWLCK